MSSLRKPKTINPDEIDPSVYYYDEVYDDMQHAQADEKETLKKSKQQGSKYIQGIIETAERRKTEKEIRKFKKFARDREEAQASGDLDDTDVYVTKSYEKKLKEMQTAMKTHSKLDEDRTLNSFKHAERHAGGKEKESSYKRDATKSSSSAEKSSEGTSRSPETSTKHEANEDDMGADDLSQKKTKVKRPVTIEERREYLKEILAKRTVGDVLKAAQERYRQRKSKT